MTPEPPFDSDPQKRLIDPIIEVYKKDVDRTMIRENLRLSVDQRLQNLEALLRDAIELRRAMRAAKTKR